MKYELLLFDLDGTLTYSHVGIYNCIRYALEKLGRGQPEEKDLRACIGPPLSESFQKRFGMSEKESELAVAAYRERYASVGLFENEPVPHAKELLKAVKRAGYTTALATAKPKIFANRIAEHFGFSPYLDLAGVATTGRGCYKKAQVVETLMKLAGKQSGECLMIGDREDDVLGAREHGVETAALTLGYAGEGEFDRVKPAFVFDTLEEIEEFLCRS